MSISESEPSARPHPWPVVFSAVVLALEAAFVAGIVAWEGVSTILAGPDSFVGAAALFVLGVIAVAWAVASVIGLARGQRWSRGSAITWQVLQFAVGIGSFQGLYARPGVGWALCVPAAVVVVVLMLPSATRLFEAPR